MSRNDLHKLVSAARSCAAAGQTSTALRHYKSALRIERRNHTLLMEAGVAAAQGGDMNTARDYLLAATKVSDHSADVQFNLGHVYLNQHLFDPALRAFNRARELDSAYPDLDFSFAAALYGLGRVQDALKSAAAATQSSPRDLDAWLLRGRCENHLGMGPQAEQTYKHLLTLQPGHIDGQLLLARNYADRFMVDQATDLLDQLMKISDLSNSALVQLGDAYGGLNQADKAVEVVERVIAKDPSDAAAHAVMGSAYIDLGDFERSESHLREALRYDPGQALAYQSLADIKRLQETDRAALERLYKSKNLDIRRRMQCGFALYHLNDRAGDFDAAFAALTHANELMREMDPQDVGANQTRLMRVKSILSPEFLAARTGQGYDGSGAVFIVGMPRSGTTLTEQILANHPAVLAGGERSDIIELRSNIKDFPDGVTALDDGWARPAGEKVFQAMFADADGETIATDKLPGNYAFLGLIQWVLPKAKFIYCQRRPEPNALSIFEQHFMTLPFSRNLKDIAIVYQNHLNIMDHWRKDCGIDVLTVDYDALVRDPEPIAKKIYDYVGLDWQPEYLDITKVDRKISTASRWQARQPINTASVERWRRYEKHLQPFVDAMKQASKSS